MGERDCGNGIDDDGDGLGDCCDDECLNDPLCVPGIMPPPEICDDQIDNDCDGLTNCDDDECAGDPACP